jgi:hypothetical protein
MVQAAIPALITGGTGATGTSDVPRWRWAGGLGIAHIVLMLGAFAMEQVDSVEHGTPPATVVSALGGVSVVRVELASYVEALAVIPLLVALVLLARLLGRRTETGRVAAQTALGLGIAYVASTFAVGFPPLTASVYAAHHGGDAGTVTTVLDLRNYGFLLQVALAVAFALALGIAATAEHRFTKWVGWGGIAVGVVGIVVTPFAHDEVSLAWMIWWLGACVLCLKGGPKDVAAHNSSLRAG